MPDLRALADLRVWVSLPREERLKRISGRDGEAALPMYLQRWIPLENAYHRAYALPDRDMLLIDGGQLASLTEDE